VGKPFYITTPIYYVNDAPHIGHAYTTIAADVLSRFHRIAGRETHYVTGTDEHGDKVAEAARAAGLTPQEFCDRIVKKFTDTWKALNIHNDYFIRTTSKRHEAAVLKLLDVMRHARTDDGREVIYSDYYEGLYCTGCEKFLTEKDLVNGLCPDHKRPPEKIREKNYFFRLTAYAPKIKALIESGELEILPEERRREVLGLINQDLPDFSVSRERVRWGISLPFDPSQVAYVWVDALSNYISAIGYADDETMFHKWWHDAEVVHLMAKDILKFHCLYWPAMLMAAGLSLPKTLFLHGFFTVDGEKMSKSLGNQIDPNAMVQQFGADATRYLLLTQYPFGVDGDVQASRFVQQYNSDLANDLGNLVSRVVKLAEVHFEGKIPPPYREIDELKPLMVEAENLPGATYESIKHFRLTHAIAESMKLIKSANKFFNDTEPWVLARKGDAERQRLGGIIYACLEVVRLISITLYPVMPRKMREVRRMLALDDSTLTLNHAMTFFDLTPHTKLYLESALFPRLDAAEAAPLKTPASTAKVDETGLADISDFGKLNLVVAQILEAENVAGADKLLRLQIDAGDGRRQIVAGIAQHYKPQDLVGRKIIVIANLKPAKIRGIESNGMLLAAKKGDKLAVVTVDGDLPPGAKVS